MSERRKEPRVPILIPLQVFDCSSDRALGELVNLSRHGLMLLCRQLIEPNRIMQIEIPLPKPVESEASLCLGVESLWREADDAQERFWVGFQIIDCSPKMTSVLEKLLEEFS